MSVLLLSDLFVQLDFNSFVVCYVKIYEQIGPKYGWMDGIIGRKVTRFKTCLNM